MSDRIANEVELMKPSELNQRVSAARKETEARGETFYPEPDSSGGVLKFIYLSELE
jgi:hypothetical protein